MLNSTKNKKQEVKSRFLSGKRQLQKKFYAFIITAMMISVSANAQIVYTDVNPDILDTCTAFYSPCSKVDSIDLNNDGIFDLKLLVYAAPTGQQSNPPPHMGGVRVSPLNSSAIKTDSSGYPLSLNLNDVIDSNGSWMTTANQTLIYRTSPNACGVVIGNWLSATDRYLGLKIISGIQTNYCWVRLNVSVAASFSFAYSSLRLKDYAYNSIPSLPILAGQTTATGIIENAFVSSINLFPNPATNHLTIELPNSNENFKVTITDITGKIIYKTSSFAVQKLEVNTEDFSAGVYVVQIQSADFIGTKKLVITK